MVVVFDKFQIQTLLAMKVFVLLLFSLASDPLALSPASEPSAFGISTECSSSSFKSATSALDSFYSCQLSISISLGQKYWKLILLL